MVLLEVMNEPSEVNRALSACLADIDTETERKRVFAHLDSQPYSATKYRRIAFRVTPCSGCIAEFTAKYQEPHDGSIATYVTTGKIKK